VLYPLQWLSQQPGRAGQTLSDHLASLERAQTEAQAARQELAKQLLRGGQVEQLTLENRQLRQLLELREQLPPSSRAAEIVYEAADPYSRKVVLDKGALAGIERGSPVIDASAVIGQITRVYPLSSEVTLVIDRELSIPVLNPRTGVRSVAYGEPALGVLELRFMASNADIQVGDLLTTSGVDGAGQPHRAAGRVNLCAHPLPTAGPGGGGAPCAGAHAAAEPAPARGGGAREGCAKSQGGTAMIMRSGQQLLLPASPLFIGASLLVALLLNMLPISQQAWMPDLLALTLLFWTVHQPLRVGIGAAFCFGLVMDVQQSALLGQNALSYTALSFLGIMVHRRLLWFAVPTQALQLLPLLLATQVLELIVRLIAGDGFPLWSTWLSPLLQALLWPLASVLLLMPQRRAPDPDANRPL
jgi:rod shape-determining protein MreD